MTDKRQLKSPAISNRNFRDSSSKLIFADSILSSQFLRDYADLEILRNIQPEDIEDVSERYVPLYSSERDSDTVKRVDISKYLVPQETADFPLYIISLVEHKTKVEYNITMQLLRYMVHIWEDYEKEMEREYPGISSRKGFKYPPILPIVYYEGRMNWTAPFDLADRILCPELLGKYLPHFRYQLVMLHDYSNADLLARGDEISLAMLINKIQTPEDMSAFVSLPGEQINDILKDTPEHLLEILAKVLRTLLYSMNLPEDEVEDAVAKVKECKMARLFENVTMDIQKERRLKQEAFKALEEAQKALEEAREEVRKEAQQELNAVQAVLAEKDAYIAELERKLAAAVKSE